MSAFGSDHDREVPKGLILTSEPAAVSHASSGDHSTSPSTSAISSRPCARRLTQIRRPLRGSRQTAIAPGSSRSGFRAEAAAVPCTRKRGVRRAHAAWPCGPRSTSRRARPASTRRSPSPVARRQPRPSGRAPLRVSVVLSAASGPTCPSKRRRERRRATVARRDGRASSGAELGSIVRRRPEAMSAGMRDLLLRLGIARVKATRSRYNPRTHARKLWRWRGGPDREGVRGIVLGRARSHLPRATRYSSAANLGDPCRGGFQGARDGRRRGHGALRLNRRARWLPPRRSCTSSAGACAERAS